MKKPTIEKFEEIADKCFGNVTHIANAFKVSRKTVYEWINQDRHFADAIELCRDKIIDVAENAVVILAQGIPLLDDKGIRVGWVTPPNPSSVHYILSTLGRKRGYGEKQEVEMKVGIHDREISREEAIAIIKELEENY